MELGPSSSHVHTYTVRAGNYHQIVLICLRTYIGVGGGGGGGGGGGSKE